VRGIVLILALLSRLAAEQLPIRAYSSADGLPHNCIVHIFPDARGFIWFSTRDGLSRFDGQAFTNFGVADGLPHRKVTMVTQSRDGNYWIGTVEGLARLDPSSPRPLETFVPEDEPARVIQSLLPASDGTIWVGTGRGLYRVVPQAPGKWRMELIDRLTDAYAPVNGLIANDSGELWIGTTNGLYRRLPSGKIDHLGAREQLASIVVNVLLRDHSGRIWVGANTGLYRLVADPKPGVAAVESHFTKADGLGGDGVSELLETRDGTLWVGTYHNLTHLHEAEWIDG